MKRDLLKSEIEKERVILRQLWDCLHFGESQRLQFIPGHSEEYTQETLDAIRKEIIRLRILLEEIKEILQQIERREWIKQEMKRFEQTASDPNRFKGSSTRLLQEEKFRKIVSKEFPRLTTNLKKTLAAWQRQHGGEAIFYDGEPYIETMNNEEDNPNFELLHLRLLTSKPSSTGAGPTKAELTAPELKTLDDRLVKPNVKVMEEPARSISTGTSRSQPRPKTSTAAVPGPTISRTPSAPKTTAVGTTTPKPKASTRAASATTVKKPQRTPSTTGAATGSTGSVTPLRSTKSKGTL